MRTFYVLQNVYSPTAAATKLYKVRRMESVGLPPNSLEQTAPLIIERGILLNLSNHKINKLFIDPMIVIMIVKKKDDVIEKDSF